MFTKYKEPNDLHVDLTSICSFNPFLRNNSSGRIQMMSSHLGQMLVINGSTERKIQTGAEREYGKYTFNVKMPVDGEIVEIIQRYPMSAGQNNIVENPQTIVIYEDVETKQLGMINLTNYCTNHQYFGFEYKAKEGYAKLAIGAFIAKDTVFLDSPNITNDGGYKYGIELNMALMSHPATSEDGILICEDILPKLKFKTYENRVVEWGNKKFALNLYGDATNYKPFPDIGDEIRADGILMALRSYEPEVLAAVEQSVKDTMDVDLNFDTTVYANGPGGRVIDIKIHHDLAKANYADVHMDKQAQKYDMARRHFYTRIVDMWKKFHKLRGDMLQITPELHRLVVEAISVTGEGGSQRINKLYRKNPLDDYRVEFTIEYEITPDIGFKKTDLHGGKGIICQIAKAEDMPVDQNGNRADIIMDPNSTVSRMNLGRVYEMYINGASRDTHLLVCKILGIKPFTNEKLALDYLGLLHKDTFNNAWNTLVGYYKIVSPNMYDWHMGEDIKQQAISVMATIVNKGIAVYFPPDNPVENIPMVQQLENSIYKPLYGPVTYRGNSGRQVTTKSNVRIASMYFVLLEKTGDDWAAVSSSKLSHFGVPSQLTKADKNTNPARMQAVRGSGEAEVRIFSSYVGERFTAELMDRNNSPKTHKELVRNLIKSPIPTNIKILIDRQKIPFGGSKPLSLVKHIALVGGWAFEYKPYVPNWGSKVPRVY